MDNTEIATADVRSWIVRRLARILGVRPEDIDVDEPLHDFGLESVEAIALISELHDYVGIQLSPGLWWEAEAMGVGQLAELVCAEKATAHS